VGLYFVDRLGRRHLTLYSQLSTVLCLGCLSLCFYFAQQTSPKLWTSSSSDSSYANECDQYRYCFDCVQDDHCGYCSSTSTSTGSHQICMNAIGDDHQNPSNETICSKSEFYPTSCPGSDLVGWMIFMILCLYLLGFAPGMGPMPWCVNSEIYPTAFRGIGNSIATTVNWSTNILMSMTFLTIIELLSKQGAFFLYSCVSFVFLLIFMIYLPETKQVPLEQIRALFSDDEWGQTLWKKRKREGRGGEYDEVKGQETCPGEERDSARESNGTNDSGGGGGGGGGGGNGSLYGGSQQSKLSYQISYNGGFLPPVDMFQSDSSSHSVGQAQQVTSRSSSGGGGATVLHATVQTSSTSSSQQSGDDLESVKSPSVVML
jgi:uncharacterized membrane protein YgcG